MEYDREERAWEGWMKDREGKREAVLWMRKKKAEQARVGCECATQEGKCYSHTDRKHECSP